ncbi:MAG TPA: ribulose-phosphate 3-epimerase [Abditibacteriaceae bacterium]|jgi:ribulose-phosphate 3-epimerase
MVNSGQKWPRAGRDVVIAPSMLAADWSRAGEVATQLAQLGCEWLHFDAMDGHFVPNLTMGPMFLQALRAHSSLHFDAHLMIERPGERIADFLAVGAESISVHVEGNAHLHRLVGQIKEGGARAGAVLNPATPVETLDVLLDNLDYVLVMSVNPGFGGQQFLPLALEKMRRLSEMRVQRGLEFLIQVDGGVAPATARDIVAAGADVLVCGSALFKGDLAESVATLRDACDEGVQARS